LKIPLRPFFRPSCSPIVVACHGRTELFVPALIDFNMSRRHWCLMLVLTATTVPGCILTPDGRPLGAGAAESLAHLAGFSPAGCSCGNMHCGEPACSFGGEAETWIGGAADCGPADCGPSGGSACETCGEESCRLECPSATCAALQAAGRWPCQAIAGTANFCIPAAAIGPPYIPPPGRFHPVPTRPVFAPRYAVAGDMAGL
jgi:hypothetical protein